MKKCVFKLHKQLLIEGGSYVNVPKGDCITEVETTYLSLVLAISVGPLSAWRVVVCGAELLWCPVCVSVETDVIVMIIILIWLNLNSLKVDTTIASSAYGDNKLLLQAPICVTLWSHLTLYRLDPQHYLLLLTMAMRLWRPGFLL